MTFQRLRKSLRSIAAVGALTITLISAPRVGAPPAQPTSAPRKPDVIFVPTPQPVVEKMLEMAEVKEGDVVYDLGCGDGRIVVTAAQKYGVKAVGFDIDPQRVREARENVRSNKVSHLVTIREADIFTLDLREASVVTLYLLPDLNAQLMPQLAQLKPGSRIVSHNYGMRGAKPIQVLRMNLDLTRTNEDKDNYVGDGSHMIYKWVVPWEAETAGIGQPATGAGPKAPPNSVIAPGAKLEKLAGDFKFTEGPTCDQEGNVFFTDQPNNRIMKWSVEGKLSTFMQPAGRANGMYFDPKGTLIACADEKTELWSITSDGKRTVLAKEYEGKMLNGPNDVWVRPDGALYFTDPFYKREWWDYNQPPQGSQQVYFLSADHKTLKRVTTDLAQPNGIIGTPDGKTLFVADIKAGKTYAYDIQPDGALANKRLRCELGSDGMTLDTEGNLYLTGKGVTVFDKTGKQIEHIDVPESWTANVSFGGKDHKTLFITASKGLYSVQMQNRGANSAK